MEEEEAWASIAANKVAAGKVTREGRTRVRETRKCMSKETDVLSVLSLLGTHKAHTRHTDVLSVLSLLACSSSSSRLVTSFRSANYYFIHR